MRNGEADSWRNIAIALIGLYRAYQHLNTKRITKYKTDRYAATIPNLFRPSSDFGHHGQNDKAKNPMR
jgi:hypothetical protein